MKKLKTIITSLLVFLFPLFFLPTTQEFYTTNKFYLLGFGVLILLLLATAEFFTTKKIVWKKSAVDVLFVVFLLFYGVSVILVSPNKIQALLNPVTGFGAFLFLVLLYFVVSKSEEQDYLSLAGLSAGIVGLLTAFFALNPFGKVTLPTSLNFLKSSNFTTLGNQVDLLLFLGFFALYYLNSLFLTPAEHRKKTDGNNLRLASFILIAAGFLLTLYNLVKPIPTQQANQSISIFSTLPPYNVSWFSAVETLKDPKTALFGVGPENFASIYTRVKPLSYNRGTFWNVNFTQSRSFILQLWTEGGLLSLAVFVLILVTVARTLRKNHSFEFYYLLLALLLFPPSLSILFLLFLLIGQAESHATGEHAKTVNLGAIMPAWSSMSLISLLVILGLGYLLGRSYVAEYNFRRALVGVASNNAKSAYDNMRAAVITNPYLERYRINFGQLNMLIANNIAARTRPQKEGDAPRQLSADERQTVTQAVQAAINEAKAAVALNPNKASSWENLAIIYRNILNVAQGADSWTVASYQRAILMDPQNPIYRLNLGGVYYALKNYTQAKELFAQATALKPDWANGHYNLAWASYQTEDFRRAAAEMDAVLKLITNKDSADYKKAQKELEEFKKKVPVQESTPSGQLELPQPPPATVEPKLKPQELGNPEPPKTNISPVKTTPTPSR